MTEDERAKNAEGVRSSEMGRPRELEPSVSSASDAVGGGEWEDKLASESGLEICSFEDECDQCDEPKGRVWADVCRGMDFTEVNEYVCAKCLPKYHADHLREVAFWDEFAEHELRRLEAEEGGRDSACEQSGAQGPTDQAERP